MASAPSAVAMSGAATYLRNEGRDVWSDGGSVSLPEPTPSRNPTSGHPARNAPCPPGSYGTSEGPCRFEPDAHVRFVRRAVRPPPLRFGAVRPREPPGERRAESSGGVGG